MRKKFNISNIESTYFKQWKKKSTTYVLHILNLYKQKLQQSCEDYNLDFCTQDCRYHEFIDLTYSFGLHITNYEITHYSCLGNVITNLNRLKCKTDVININEYNTNKHKRWRGEINWLPVYNISNINGKTNELKKCKFCMLFLSFS